MGCAKRLFRDYAALVTGLDSHFDGQVQILDNSDDLRNLSIKIKPKDGVYRGGSFMFTIHAADNYPDVCPTLNCLTPIYHPNIDTEAEDSEDPSYSNICLNLFDEWTNDMGLLDAIQGLLFLLYEPNLDDSLSPYFSSGGMDYDEFEETVRQSLRGEVIDDWIQLTRNLDDDEIDTIDVKDATKNDITVDKNDVTIDADDATNNAQNDVRTDTSVNDTTNDGAIDELCRTSDTDAAANDDNVTHDVKDDQNDVTNVVACGGKNDVIVQVHVARKCDFLVFTIRALCLTKLWTKFLNKCYQMFRTVVRATHKSDIDCT